MSMKAKKNIQPVSAYPYNAQHIGSRTEQQDYFVFSEFFNADVVSKYGYIAALADGMGGMKYGAVAGYMTVRTYMDSYKARYNGDIMNTMLTAANCANEQVKKLDGAGATLCGVVIKDWLLNWISVGDSHIYLYRKGRVCRLNKEHNLSATIDRLVASGKLSKADAAEMYNRHALTSYIGIDTLSEIDYSVAPIPLQSGDSIMLCSDGLYRDLSLREMARILKYADEDVAEKFIKKVLKKKKKNQDNITVMVIDVD